MIKILDSQSLFDENIGSDIDQDIQEHLIACEFNIRQSRYMDNVYSKAYKTSREVTLILVFSQSKDGRTYIHATFAGSSTNTKDFYLEINTTDTIKVIDVLVERLNEYRDMNLGILALQKEMDNLLSEVCVS